MRLHAALEHLACLSDATAARLPYTLVATATRPDVPGTWHKLFHCLPLWRPADCIMGHCLWPGYLLSASRCSPTSCTAFFEQPCLHALEGF